jgi:hypothetical protein
MNSINQSFIKKTESMKSRLINKVHKSIKGLIDLLD